MGSHILVLFLMLGWKSFTIKYDVNFEIFFNFIIIIILLYNIVLVLPYINMHPPQVYTCSPSWTPLPPPSPYHQSCPTLQPREL